MIRRLFIDKITLNIFNLFVFKIFNNNRAIIKIQIVDRN